MIKNIFRLVVLIGLSVFLVNYEYIINNETQHNILHLSVQFSVLFVCYQIVYLAAKNQDDAL